MLRDLVEAWRHHLALDRRRSTHTVRAYMATAERLIAFLEEHRGGPVSAATLATVEQADLRAFLTVRRMDGIGNGSAARELSAVRGFLKFTGGEDARVPLLKGPRVKRGLPRPVSPDEAVALAADIAESAREEWIGARDWAVLLLLYGAGLRIGEAMALTGDVMPLGETLRVTGKRGKTRIVPLLPQVREAIEKYVVLCPYPLEQRQPLFRGARGGHCRQQSSGGQCRAHGAGWDCPIERRPTRCGTVSRRICSDAGRTYARFRNCWGMPACHPRRFIPRWMRPICWTCIATRIHAPDRIG